MGRTSRWLASLLGWKKSENNAASNSGSKQKKWRFGKSYRETKGKSAPPSVQPIPVAAEERRGSYREVLEDEEEESKRAIAVAAATAAVAEAAVAAAHAAAEVVKLTSGGGGRSMRGGGGKREEWAAIKIQSFFRGYLARRALRALKGLVRLQALARGNIVRKQVAETLRCMHALVRVQARARACRALKSELTPLDKPPQSNGPRSQRSTSVKRSSLRNSSRQTGDHGRSKSAGWNWLDQQIEDKYSDDEKNTKILEIDPGKPSNSKQTPKKQHQQHNRNQFMMTSSCSTLTQPETPSKDSTATQLSVPSPSTIDMAESSFYPNYQISYEESPYYSATSRPGSSKRGGFTPAKSEYSGSYTTGGYTDYYPNYMTNTKSSSAKVRSQSAPKQRPAQFEKLPSVKKVSNNLQLKFASKGYPGSGRLDRLGMPIGY